MLAGLGIVPFPSVDVRAAEAERRKGQGRPAGPDQLFGQQCVQVGAFAGT